MNFPQFHIISSLKCPAFTTPKNFFFYVNLVDYVGRRRNVALIPSVTACSTTSFHKTKNRAHPHDALGILQGRPGALDLRSIATRTIGSYSFSA